MKRTITGRSARTMTLGDLRQFIASLDGLPDDASVKARVTLGRRHLRSVTVEEEDIGFHDCLRAVGAEGGRAAPAPDQATPDRKGSDRRAGAAKESTSA